MNIETSSRDPSTFSSSGASPSTIRPRNRRLISIDNDSSNQSRVNGNDSSGTLLETSFQSRRPSRAVSPIPSKHPSRSASLNTSPQRWSVRSGRPLGVFGSGVDQATPTTFATGLWETSWTSLQSIASNLLGNETTKGMRDQQRGTTKPSRRSQAFYTTHRRTVSNAPPTQWGPAAAGDAQIGIGTQEERQAFVKAKKRETLLEANGHAFSDSNGRFKRRVSDDRGSMSAPPTEHEDRDALVYIHHVQPDDTLAGVMIKYNCQPAIFRKANRLWPNDNIQVRKTVVLPVEACGVKGRKIPGPEEQNDPLSGDTMKTPSSNGSNVDGPWGESHASASSPPQPSTAASLTTSLSLSTTHHDDPPWKHDSWVLIDPYPAAIEIARLPRRTLGFFPPSRRKSRSNSFSDLDSSTPPASLDLPCPHPPPTSPTRHDRRRQKSRSSSGSYFAHPHHLHGPGGVGTLERNASPGPAQDGLNKLFAAHLPNVAPRSSFESTTSTSSTAAAGIENVGGAIEGWVRKLATRAATIIEPLPGAKSAAAGDLIELSDAFDPGDDEGGGDGGEQPVAAGIGSGSATDERSRERSLRERLPLRGRLVSEVARRKKGD